ncbi:MAG: hypothetical protein HUU22_15365 [Phycisphaerae bacterium]|nr:hypothetical protein [Phycisphaerae bacterium]NUQ47403.1 hypothetical protein [Phycisphaerae bacterium]
MCPICASRICGWWLPAVILAFVAGCAAPRKTAPPVDPATLSDDGFLHYLAEVPLVTTDEAYRAMLILADGEDTCKSFEERRDKLVQRQIVNPAWDLQPDHVIDRGSVAAMVCKICRLRGGLNRVLFASWGLGDRRYANRELVYRDLLDPGTDYVPIKGGQLVALMTKADALMEERGIYETVPVELGGEADAVRIGAEGPPAPAAEPEPPPAESDESSPD